METETIAILIPIVAIVMSLSLAMVGLWLDYRRKSEIFALHHQERMAAIEKGMDVPPLPPELFHRAGRLPGDYLRRGLVWLLVGGAVTVAIYYEHGHGALFGLIPMAAGLANLIFFVAMPRLRPTAGTSGEPGQPGQSGQ
jgi:hypothetical protein